MMNHTTSFSSTVEKKKEEKKKEEEEEEKKEEEEEEEPEKVVRDELVNPIWAEDKEMGNGPIGQLPKKELIFFQVRHTQTLAYDIWP